MMVATVLAVSLALAVTFSGCRLRSNNGNGYNLLLITLDTTRADRLGCYGYSNAITPSLDRLAARGTLLEHAYCTVPLTLPSHATILTGLLPPEHGLRVNNVLSLPEGTATIATILSTNGYDTSAFVATPILSSQFGLDRGFRRYDDSIPSAAARGREAGMLYRSGDNVVDAALDWLRQDRDKPFFCWVNLYDPHYPYHAHEALFGDRFTNMPYDAEIAFADIQVGRLMDCLDQLALRDKTLIVVAGDHGESSLPADHAEPHPYHGYMLYNGTMRVPVLFSLPGRVASSRRLPSPFSLTGILPTVLRLLDLPVPQNYSGSDITTALTTAKDHTSSSIATTIATNVVCYGETQLPASYGWGGQTSLTTPQWKYIRSPKSELFDLVADPGELTNLIDRMPLKVVEMERRLSELDQTRRQPTLSPNILSAEARRQLESLGGYVSGGLQAGTNSSHGDLRDIKDMLEILTMNQKAGNLLRAGRNDEALALYRSIVESSPETPVFRSYLGAALVAGEHFKEGIDELTKLKLLLESETVAATEASGAARRPSGKEHPLYSIVLNNLAFAMAKDGRAAEALPMALRALKGDQRNAAFHHSLAVIYLALDQLEEAESSSSKALSYDPENSEFLLTLAGVSLKRGNKDKASRCARQVLDLAANEKDRAQAVRILEDAEGKPK